MVSEAKEDRCTIEIEVKEEDFVEVTNNGNEIGNLKYDGDKGKDVHDHKSIMTETENKHEDEFDIAMTSECNIKQLEDKVKEKGNEGENMSDQDTKSDDEELHVGKETKERVKKDKKNKEKKDEKRLKDDKRSGEEKDVEDDNERTPTGVGGIGSQSGQGTRPQQADKEDKMEDKGGKQSDGEGKHKKKEKKKKKKKEKDEVDKELEEETNKAKDDEGKKKKEKGNKKKDGDKFEDEKLNKKKNKENILESGCEGESGEGTKKRDTENDNKREKSAKKKEEIENGKKTDKKYKKRQDKVKSRDVEREEEDDDDSEEECEKEKHTEGKRKDKKGIVEEEEKIKDLVKLKKKLGKVNGKIEALVIKKANLLKLIKQLEDQNPDLINNLKEAVANENKGGTSV